MNYRRIIITGLIGFILIGCSSKKDKIDLLFLGHESEHHDAQVYATTLSKYLFEKGVEMEFAYSPEVLSTDYLKNFDALIIYANHDSITDTQNNALLSFVEDGGAFLPLHCASACFTNSSEYIDLVGGQFKSHGVDSFITEFAKPDHPILKGIVPFYAKDETYVHSNLSDDKEIIIMRGDEPWTWTREQGKGKVFYTAYGHDENTWNLPQFQQMIFNALKWTTGIIPSPIAVKVYKEAKLPNYRKIVPEPQYQMPLSPEESMKMTQVPPGFKLELFASEPDIINPIAFTWDERGRLWVLETIDYPNEVRNSGGLDRVKILEDTNNDGKADKVTVFADSLNIPTGITFVNGGVLVSSMPNFYFLKDTNDDDIADIKEEVLPGWGAGDTHAGPSNLKYGLDNKIWGAVGYSAYSHDTYNFRMGIYRFDKDFSMPEFISQFDNNTWGLAFDESFNVFGSTANNTHSIQVAMPNRYFSGSKGIKWFGNKKIDGHYSVHPITDKFLQVDVFNGFTAAAGHNVYTGSNFPSSYKNKVAFVCEPTVHLIHRAELSSQGSEVIEHDGWNIVASADEWFSPVHAETGPDGALWFSDWYNFIIQHNPTPVGFENGKGNAYLQPLRDKQHGRIYRIVYAGNELDKYPALSTKEQLVDALSHENMFWRITAQRLIVESLDNEYEGLLLGVLEGENPKAIIHALGALDGLNLLSNNVEKVKSLLGSDDASVKKNALKFLSDISNVNAEIERYNLLNDNDFSVRIEALISLKNSVRSEGLIKQIVEMSMDLKVNKDAFLSQAVYLAMEGNSDRIIPYVKANYPDKLIREEELTNYESFSYNDSKWKQFYVPKRWDNELGEFTGEIWFRTSFNIQNKGKENYELNLGPIDENDITYVNGVEVGKMTDFKWTTPRVYSVPNRVLREGKNVISIKVENRWGTGGIYGKDEELFIKNSNKKIELKGNWRYKIQNNLKPTQSIFSEEDILNVFLKNYLGNAKPLVQIASKTESKGREIVLLAVKFKIKFDLKEFEVKPGEKIRLKFINEDVMRHNVLIGKKDALQVIGKAADLLATDPKGSEKNWVPEMPEVLYSTKLVDAGAEVILEFTAPNEKGEYPFVCTFPGHWRTMNGVMIVK